MKLALALGLSLCVHLAGYGLVRAWVPRAPLPLASAPASPTVDIVVSGGRLASAARPAEAAPLSKRGRKQRAHPPAHAVAVSTRFDDGPVLPPPSVETALDPGSETPSTKTPTEEKGAESASVRETEPAGSPAPMALDLRPFFQRLQSSAQRCAGARQGAAQVRFCVDALGHPADVSLVKSSGNFALDDAALHCVIPGAAPLPLTDRCLVVPLVFK